MMSAEVITPAILQFIDNSAFPDTEDVVSAQLAPPALSHVLEALRTEQEAVRQEIREVSKRTAPDIDTWIARAKELQADIIRSRDTARQIVAEAEAGRDLRAQVKESENKVFLLEKEVAFNEVLTGTLEHIRHASVVLDGARDAAVKGHVEQALEKLEDAEASIAGLQAADSSRAYGLLRSRSAQLRENLVEAATLGAKRLIIVDTENKKLSIGSHDPAMPETTIENAFNAAKLLGVLDIPIQRLCRDIDQVILKPSLSSDREGNIGEVIVSGNTIQCGSRIPVLGPETVFAGIRKVVDFLNKTLPPSISILLSESLMPALFTRLEDSWLQVSIPVQMSEIPPFEDTLTAVLELAETLDKIQWAGSHQFREWVHSAPKAWLTKRREAVLGEIRDLVFAGVNETRQVERVESQTVGENDELAPDKQDGNDDWDNAWDEPDEPKDYFQQPTTTNGPAPAEDEEDGSAWGFDEDGEEDKQEDKDGEEAWGWGDDDIDRPTSPTTPRRGTFKVNYEPATPLANPQAKTEREVVMRENYTVTAVPDAILDIIKAIISDAEVLAGPEYASSPIAPGAAGLYALPTLALAIYRATAPTAYNKLYTGNMLIYNDATRLSEQLRAWQAAKPPASRLRLDNDAKMLDQFAKSAYSTEMESQRTILRDLLDGAQGFANTTVEPFKSATESAIEQTVYRLHEVYRQWKPILSQSALLQSLGSLLGTVTGKMVVDIEELGDIAEDDSKQLKILCERVTKVTDIFVQDSPQGQASDMTFIYCPNWLKFQYMAEILDSSLADIKYLWNEGELSLEFEAEEVVELIEALFAESDLRRVSIAEIRRDSNGR